MYKFLLIFLLCSCSVIEDYKYVGEETLSGTIEYEFHLHEHFKNEDSTHECFYYHDTITEVFDIKVENIKRIKKIVWQKKSH